jgi:hypothetical protein
MEEVDWNISGKPKFAIVGDFEWDKVYKLLNHLLFGEECSDEDYKIKEKLIPLKPEIKSELSEIEADPFVVVTPAAEYYYSFETKQIEEADLMICQVNKPKVRPFTVILSSFNTEGYTRLFTDLFACDDWGRCETDIKFLKDLWAHLKMVNEFDIEALLKTATEGCYPNESGLIYSEPVVYRKTIEEILNGEARGMKF